MEIEPNSLIYLPCINIANVCHSLLCEAQYTCLLVANITNIIFRLKFQCLSYSPFVPESDCGGGVMDLVFVIDGSKSLGTANFDRVKKWVSGIVETLAVSKRGTQVGLIQYSTKVRTEFTLAQHHSAQAIQQAVASMQYMGRGSMTGSALRHMFERSFSAAQGGRHGVPRACVVFTDGRSQDDVSGWATKAKQAGTY